MNVDEIFIRCEVQKDIYRHLRIMRASLMVATLKHRSAKGRLRYVYVALGTLEQWGSFEVAESVQKTPTLAPKVKPEKLWTYPSGEPMLNPFEKLSDWRLNEAVDAFLKTLTCYQRSVLKSKILK